MNTLIAVAIAPLGVGDEVAPQVAQVVDVIRQSGLPSKTNSMFTEIEGEWDEVFKVVKDATAVLTKKGIRTEVVLKADVRPGHENMMQRKVEKVNAILGDNGECRTQAASSMRDTLDISAYLVLGRENTQGRPVGQVVAQALDAGFTCIQVRSKVSSGREMIDQVREAADAIAAAGKSDKVALLVDDRLDVVLAAREQGIKVDGIHVGQTDIPVEACRKLLGPDSIVGLSARTDEMAEYIKTADLSAIDYLGVGPLHETQTKPDCGRAADGQVITKSLADLSELARVSPLPIVVGGGVKAADIPALAKTGVDGFFVVSAVCGADDPHAAAQELVTSWKASL
jgi:uncharacterized protein (TIGR00106 family)